MSRSGASFSPQSKEMSLGMLDIREYPAEVRQMQPGDENRQFVLGDVNGDFLLYICQTIALGFPKFQDKGDYLKLVEQRDTKAPIDFENEIIEKRLKEYHPEEEAEGEEHSQKMSDECLDEILKDIELAIELYQEQLDEYEAIMSRVDVVNTKSRLLDGGDLKGDRGICDWRTLRFSKTLIDKGCQLYFALGNHDVDFIFATKFNKLKFSDQAHGLPFDTVMVPEGTFNHSLQNMGKLLKWGLLDAETIIKMVDDYLIPRLCIIDCKRDKIKSDSVTFFNHAPNLPNDEDEDLLVEKLLTLHEIAYDLKDRKGLEKAVDQLNDEFRLWLNTVSKDRFVEVFSDENHPYYQAVMRRDAFLPKMDKLENVYLGFGHDTKLQKKKLPAAVRSKLMLLDNDETKAIDGPVNISVGVTTFFATPVKVEQPDEKQKRKRRVAGMFSPMKEAKKSADDEHKEKENFSARPGHAATDQ